MPGLESRISVWRAIISQLEERKSTTAHTKKHQTTSRTGHDEISIHVVQKYSFEHPLSFEVCVLVTLGGHHVEWTMDMLPGTRVPIQLDHDQRLMLIAVDQDLLLDSRWMQRAFPFHFREEARNETQDLLSAVLEQKNRSKNMTYRFLHLMEGREDLLKRHDCSCASCASV